MTDTKPHAEHEGARTPLELAQQFHEAYERLAPSFGYETRKASAKPWAEVPENNRKLMEAVCAEIMCGSARGGARTPLRELIKSWRERAAKFDDEFELAGAIAECSVCADELERALAIEGPGEAERLLRETLQTIADFAVGHGDVCEIIAKHARAALAGAQVPPATPAYEGRWIDEPSRQMGCNAEALIWFEQLAAISQREKLWEWAQNRIKELNEKPAAAPQPQEGAALRPEQLIAVSFDPTQDASLPPKGRWIYLETALKTIDAVRKDAEVEISLLRGRIRTIGIAGEFGSTNYEVVKRLRELETTSDQARQYMQHAQQREHTINELREELERIRKETIERCRIAYEAHYFDGLLDAEKCERCGLNIRDGVHLGAGETRETRLRALASAKGGIS